MINIIKKYGVEIIVLILAFCIIFVTGSFLWKRHNSKDKIINANINQNQNKNNIVNIAEKVKKQIPEFTIPKPRKPTEEEAEKYPQFTNLPAMYITYEKDFSKIQHSVYSPARYTLVDGDTGIYDELLMIKGRGNYSWSSPKKPYTIKLAKETSLLGMKSAQTWTILSEYVDKTLIRDYLTFTLAADVGLEGSPDCRFVDMFFNGKYNGTYLLSDSIQIHENRVNIDPSTEAIFEAEAIYRHNDHTYCIDMLGGNHHNMYKEPDSLEHDAKLENLEGFKEFFQEMQKSLKEGYWAYSQYIDVDSFINWYIVNELCKNYDSGFTSSCFNFIKNGKLYMGPVWDYHTCYGNQNVATGLDPKGYHVRESPWYSILFKDETFHRLLCERWTQLRNDGVIDNFLKRIDNTVNYISESVIENFKIWREALKENGLRGRTSTYTYDDEIDYLINWVNRRIEWLDSEWYIK